MSITGNDNFFEDFHVGDVYGHARGKTITEMDNLLITHLVMNTAQGHFNEDRMRSSPLGQRVVFGGVTASIVIGLAAEDTAEHCRRELGMANIRFRLPVFHGDTLYAFSEVLATEDPGEPGVGKITFRHYGINQRDELVFEGDRMVLLDRRPTDADGGSAAGQAAAK